MIRTRQEQQLEHVRIAVIHNRKELAKAEGWKPEKKHNPFVLYAKPTKN